MGWVQTAEGRQRSTASDTAIALFRYAVMAAEVPESLPTTIRWLARLGARKLDRWLRQSQVPSDDAGTDTRAR